MNTDQQLNFLDIIKKSVVSNFASDISISNILIRMSIAFFIGLFIYLLYKRVFCGVLYSKSFNVTLIGITMVTTMIIIAVGSNLILSLGMVGALSIVRFRTPIKDPTDLIFIFWGAAAGIVVGAGFYPLAVAASIMIGIVMYIFSKKVSFETPYLMVVNCNGDDSEKHVFSLVHDHAKRYNLKQKNVSPDNIELTLEVRVKDKESSFVNKISAVAGVKNAVLISYNGDYVS